MTGKVVNLRQVRKRKARDTDRRSGDTNAALFGETKGARIQRKTEKVRADSELDGKKRE